MLTWLALALVSAIIEVSIPHFGFAFVSAGAVAAALMAFLGFSVPTQMATFVVVMTVSIVGLRSGLVRLIGQGWRAVADRYAGRPARDR